MVAELGLSGLEAALAQAFQTNHYALALDDARHLGELVLSYVSLSPSIGDQDLVLIKKITTVAKRILQSDPSSFRDGLPEKLFKLSIEGAKKARLGIHDYNPIALESYFLGDAGYAAKVSFERTGFYPWAEEWYETKKKSAELAASIDPRYSANSYKSAGDAAMEMSRATKNPLWAERAIDCYTNFLTYYKKNPDPKMRKITHLVKKDISFVRQFAR